MRRSGFARASVLVLTCVWAATSMAAPVVIFSEVWGSGWSGGNVPLSASRLADPRTALALNQTNAPATFVSSNGYVYTDGQAGNPWAFSLAPSNGTYMDFTHGPQDLAFKPFNTLGGQFQAILAENAGSGYVISDTVYTASGWPVTNVDFDATTWKSLDIGTMTAGAAVTPDLSSIHEVGFARLTTTGIERIDNILVQAVPQAPNVLNETWPGWSSSAPGRKSNEPLDNSKLGDARGTLAVNNTGGSKALVSSGGYIYTGEQSSSKWAFTLMPSTSGYYDFSQGANDLTFSQRNTSGGQFQVVLSQGAGTDYAVSDQVFSSDGWTGATADFDAMTWKAFNPDTLAVGGAVTPDTSSIWEVGFTSLATTGVERIDNVKLNGFQHAAYRPTVLIDEPWASYWPLDPGRAQDEPLNAANHLTDPRAAVGLDATNGLPFVSRSGYVFTGAGGQDSEKWAFTLKRAQGGYFDFTHDEYDLTFEPFNNSGGQFRVLISDAPGSSYYVSDQVFTASGFPATTVDLDSMTWRTFDPVTKAAGATATPAFSNVWEVGFASLVNVATERIDDIVVRAVPKAPTLIHETWPGWNGNASGRQWNEPLTPSKLGDPNAVLALNATNGAAFVSSSGYIFTGIQPSAKWAFSLAQAVGGTFDFTQGIEDMLFDMRGDGPFRVLLSEAVGDRYVVSATTFSHNSGTFLTDVLLNFDDMDWLAFDPTTMTIGGAADPNLSRIAEVGFASLVTYGTERIDNIRINAVHVPEPATLALLGIGLAALRRRRR